MKDGIIELRQKGASLRLIHWLVSVGVAVGTDTIARFLDEMNGESQSLPGSERPIRGLCGRRRAAHVQRAAVPPATAGTTGNSPPPQRHL